MGKWGNTASLDAEKLGDLYKDHTDQEIGVMFDVTDTAIASCRHKWGIKTISPRQRREQAEGRTKSVDELTPVSLTGLYAQMGDQQIANLYGVSKPTIKNLRRKWGISALSKSERSTHHDEITDVQKEVFIGSLLGDAHLLERGAFKVTHCVNQSTYLKRLHSLLSPLALPIFYEEKTLLSGVVAFAFGFRTVQHSWLTALRSIFYPKGTKVFPESILKELTPLSLAMWYFDDGHLDSGLPSIALGDCGVAEAEKVIELVRERFSLDAYYKPQSTDSCHLLGLRARSADAFFYMIREHVTTDMLHKLPKKHWPSGVIQAVPVKTYEPVVLPKDLRQQSTCWSTLEGSDQEALLDSLADFWQTSGFPHAQPKPEELFALHGLEVDHVIQGGVIKPRQVGQSTCQAFCQHIWEARNQDSKMSPAAIFADKDTLRQALRVRLDAGYIPEAAQVRAALRYLRRSGVYNFRPSAAKALVDRYCRPGGAIWDPCAGYGGRLLGSLLSKAQPRYVACEPQAETFARLHHLRDWLDTYVPGAAGRVSLHEVPAEEFEPPSGGVDMVLTSPPYWKKEVYGDAPTQSGIRYPTYSSWLEGFWRPVIDKAVKALHPGGWLVLNVDDFNIGKQPYPLIEDTHRLVRESGLKGEPEVYQYSMPMGSDQENSEVVLCWVKSGETLVAAPVKSLEIGLAVCKGCGEKKPLVSMKDGVCSDCQKPLLSTVCKGCGIMFHALRKDNVFHDEACNARWKRREMRKEVPAKTTRTFTCIECGEAWETDALGHFTICPKCKEAKEIQGRAKTCEYRYCGVTFVDTSPKNGMRFCCEEHRRREKMFRSGKATDESYFRKPD